MYPSIIITKGNELAVEEWCFTLFDFELVLESYAVKTRETKKHKFRTISSFNRLRHRECTLKADEVPLADELKKEAIKTFSDKLSVRLPKS